MKMKQICVLITGCLALSLNVLAQDNKPHAAYSSSTDYKGVEWKQEVSFAVLAKTPQWDPETQDCPLLPAKAIKAAREFLRKQFPETAGWAILDVNMTNPALGNRWVYDICFEPKDTLFKGDLHVVVLLDGTVPKMIKAK